MIQKLLAELWTLPTLPQFVHWLGLNLDVLAWVHAHSAVIRLLGRFFGF